MPIPRSSGFERLSTWMLKGIVSIMLFVGLAAGCKSYRTPPPGAETTSNDAPIPWVDNTPSKYDEINIPIIKFDSLLLYKKVYEVLKSTNSLNQNGFTSYYDVNYKVRDKNFVLIKRHGASELKEEVEDIERIFFELVTIIEPASLIGDPSVKTEYTIELSLAVAEREVLLSVCGVEGNCYLKYSFSRPL